jgi:predicted lactoylglutathione lyase
MTTPRLFVNLGFDDLDRTLESFTIVGFSFDERATDETPTGMVIGEDAYAMLSPEPRFTMKPISHGRTHIETIRAISAESAVRRSIRWLTRRWPRAGHPRARARSTGSRTPAASTIPMATTGK